MAKKTATKARKGKATKATKGAAKKTAPMGKAKGLNPLGYPKGTKRDFVLGMYTRTSGATQAQVVAATKAKYGKGYPFRNMLRAIRDNHATHTVSVTKVADKTTGRMVKCYRVVTKAKAKAA